MGEQNRRAVELESPPSDGRRGKRPGSPVAPAQDPSPERALSPEADERQTVRQAPPRATPGESAEDDTIG
jgi:hypothetical protein